MQFTKSAIQEMNESELRTQVLIPLFTAMGYRDVQHYHGGSQEQGKDIVMWKVGDLGVRTNYAVVVKAHRISGKVSGKTSAAEVGFQIRQCFSSPFPDRVTLQSQRVDRCMVVSSWEISKEAQLALQNFLGEELGRLTYFIDGDRLWELVKTHLPVASLQGLWEAGERLGKLSDNYAIVSTVRPEGVMLTVEPKHAEAERKEPLLVSATFQFDDSPEGKRAFEAFQKHFKTGSPVTIAEGNIKELHLPDVLQPLFPPDRVRGWRIEVGPRAGLEPLTIRLSVTRDSETKASLEPVIIEATQVGEDEITWENRSQRVPWKLRMVFRKDPQEMTFTYRADYDDVDARTRLMGMEFEEALSQGGGLRVEDATSRVAYAIGQISPGVFPAPEGQWVDLVRRVATIQEKTGKLLRVPSRDITEEEVKRVYMVDQVVRVGYLEHSGKWEVMFRTGRETAQNTWQALVVDKAEGIVVVSDELESIFGVSLALGRAANVFTRHKLFPEDEERLPRLFADPDCSSFEIRLFAEDDGAAQKFYEQWLPQEDKDRLPPNFFGVPGGVT